MRCWTRWNSVDDDFAAVAPATDAPEAGESAQGDVLSDAGTGEPSAGSPTTGALGASGLNTGALGVQT